VSLTESVRLGLATLAPLDDRDRAVADIALGYAKQLDAGDVELLDAGPKLQSALAALLLTPAARAAAVKAAPTKTETKTDPLDELQVRRANQRAAKGSG
jgi:hypothetical protein